MTIVLTMLLNLVAVAKRCLLLVNTTEGATDWAHCTGNSLSKLDACLSLSGLTALSVNETVNNGS